MRSFRVIPFNRDPTVKAVYFSMLFVIEVIFLPNVSILCRKMRWVWHDFELWKNTWIISVFGLIRSFRLHGLCTSPRYFPVMKKLLFTASLKFSWMKEPPQKIQSVWSFLSTGLTLSSYCLFSHALWMSLSPTVYYSRVALPSFPPKHFGIFFL